MSRKSNITSLYYITHIDNVPSILAHGILSHSQIQRLGIETERIYNFEIVDKRKAKQTPSGQSLWEYANLYFQPRNPMMYRVIHALQSRRDLAVIGVDPAILETPSVVVTDGNAASDTTSFFEAKTGLKAIKSEWKTIQSQWWNDLDGSKRKIMAECLVPEKISPEFIHTVFVVGDESQKRIKEAAGRQKIPVVVEPNMFFQPSFGVRVGENIWLLRGDMFFSKMQTLTVSVNLQGVMGKGLASRAKYQFPDVYVYYQDACRAKRVTESKPHIYKREASLDQELADLSIPLDAENAVKWFLLFATKRRWQEKSRLEDIESGLDWCKKNLVAQKVVSIALPALGCGLGGLEWGEVGPIMCRYLHRIGIPVEIYLPQEKESDPTHLSADYLLKGT